MKSLFTLLTVFLTFSLFAQVPTQTLRGEVRDAVTRTAYPGVAVSLLDREANVINAVFTDADGNFSFADTPVGRYRVRAELLGYQTVEVSETEVKGGKETVLLLELAETADYDLPVATVKSPRTGSTHPVSIQTLTIEETLRFPATYFDPARLAVTLPGVLNTNDQSNSLAVRGNSPNALSWRLEGAEIVNPNHTPNAGTATDRITLNGGGVNMLSAQMLGNTAFLTGAFPAPYGNALGAIMDMNLREGNRKEYEFTGQIGLIGIDVAAEGPLSKQENAAIAANYRYSTVGLLSQLGVDLGDEEISFQDLAVKADFYTKGGGRFSVFGIGGKSKNIFAAQRDTAAWEVQKDRFDINFNSRTGILGGSYGQSIGSSSYWKTTLVHSATDNVRTGERLADDLTPTLTENDRITYQKTALHSVFSRKLSARNQLKIGLDAVLHRFDVLSEDFTTRLFSEGEGEGVFWQPFVMLSTRLSEKLSADFGFHYAYFAYNNTSSPEPRAAFSYRLNDRSSLNLAGGLHSQLQLPQLYLARTATDGSNQNLELTKAAHAILSYKLQTEKGDNITAEAYYQYLFDVPEPFPGGTNFSALNLFESFTGEPLQSTGTGRNIGLELSWQKFFTGNLYYLFNVSLYDAQYTAVSGRRFDTRYNGNYILNATVGKEWTRNKNNKVKTFGLNLHSGYAGGLRYTPIDLEASRAAGTTVFDNDNPFSEQFSAFFKTDVRITWKKSKAGRNTIWAIDIQNITNSENAAFRYFDTETGTIITKNQLGLLPILTWRIEW